MSNNQTLNVHRAICHTNYPSYCSLDNNTEKDTADNEDGKRVVKFNNGDVDLKKVA